jgi:hypothetical protein
MRKISLKKNENLRFASYQCCNIETVCTEGELHIDFNTLISSLQIERESERASAESEGQEKKQGDGLKCSSSGLIVLQVSLITLSKDDINNSFPLGSQKLPLLLHFE